MVELEPSNKQLKKFKTLRSERGLAVISGILVRALRSRLCVWISGAS